MKLYYSIGPFDGEFFAQTADGDPVFPVFEKTEAEHLNRLASLFGAFAEEVDRKPNTRRAGHATNDKAKVASLGAKYAGVARLYASLTGRCAIVLNDKQQFAREIEKSNIEIIIFDHEQWTSELVSIIQPPDPGKDFRVIGLLPAVDLDDAYRQCVRRAAALYLSHQALPGSGIESIHILPNIQVSIAKNGKSILLGAGAKAEVVESAMKAGVQILAIQTHSDGLDSPLPGGKILCAIKGRRRSFHGIEPCCSVTGLCHRLDHAPIGEALHSNRLIGVANIKSRIFLNWSCYVLPVNRGGVSSIDTIGGEFIREAVFGCFIASNEVIFTNSLRAHRDARLVASSPDAGTALQRVLTSYHNNEQRPRLFCFGDPKLAIASRQDESISTRDCAGMPQPNGKAARQDDPQERKREQVAVMIRFLESMHKITVESIPCESERIEVEAKWSGTLALTRDLAKRRCSLADLQRLESETARCIPLLRREIPDAWSNLGATWETRRSEVCPHCNTSVQTWVCEIIGPATSRTILNCPNCGVSQDAPVDFDRKIRISPSGMVRLVSDSFDPDGRFFVRVHSHQRSGPLIRELGFAQLTRGYQISSEFELPLPAQVSCFALVDCEMGVFSRNVVLLPWQ